MLTRTRTIAAAVALCVIGSLPALALGGAGDHVLSIRQFLHLPYSTQKVVALSALGAMSIYDSGVDRCLNDMEASYDDVTRMLIKVARRTTADESRYGVSWLMSYFVDTFCGGK